MFRLAHRGQAPAKGILHAEHRTPLSFTLGADGRQIAHPDPRGYFNGQRANPARAARRAAVKAAGGIRQFKKTTRNL